jgi:hypothetical protein
MINSSQVSKLSIEIIPENRINTKLGIIYLCRLLNYKKHFSRLGKAYAQKSVTTLMLDDVLDSKYILTHHKNGAPILENKSFNEISISHSNGYFAVYLSYNQAVGIDVEVRRTIHHNGLEYFLNDKEIKHSWSDCELLIIWCTKEAYFKLKKGEVEDLRADVTVTDVLKEEIIIKTPEDCLTFNIVQGNNYSLVYN